VGTVGNVIGRLDFTYGRGGMTFTTLHDVAQSREWPGSLSFDPDAYQGVRTTSGVYALTWRHDLWRQTDRHLTLEASASYQTEARTAGSLEPDWEREHRSPTGGFMLSPMRFLVETDRFSSDTGPYAVTRLEQSEEWEQLTENFIFDRGTRVPYLGRLELNARGHPRVNPWGAAQRFPTTGPAVGYPNTEFARERRRWAKVAVDWRATRLQRLRAGVEFQGADVRYFEGNLVRVAGADAFTETPWRFAIFASDRVDFDRVAVEVGLRWERFDIGARLPIAPGRIFTNPVFDPNDPTLDGVLAPVEAHDVFLPRAAVGVRLAAGTGLRLSYTSQARMPDVGSVMAGSVADLANDNRSRPYGRDVDWVKSGLVELGLRQRIGRRVVLDVTGYRRQITSGLVYRIVPFFDPFADRTSWVAALTNADTGAVHGAEFVANIRGSSWMTALASYTYQDAKRAGAREHTVAGVVGLEVPAHLGAGRWYGAVLRGLEGVMRFRLASGLRYTSLTNSGFGFLVPPEVPVRSIADSVPRSSMPWITELDLRVVKGFRIGGATLRAFVDFRNLFGSENVAQVFAETGETENDLHREASLLDSELLILEQDARATGVWVQVTKDGRVVEGADVSDCSFWAGTGSEPACVALRRAETRWGDGDGVYDVEEFTAALNALYDLFSGRWTMLGASRQVRLGLEVRF
jgi:hypothetical protein